MNQEIRKLVREVLIIAAAFAAFLFVMHRFFPEPGPVHAPVAVVTPSPVERETQALIDALASNSGRNAGVSPLIQPAVTVIKDSGAVGGLSSAQVAQILGALKPKTVEKVAVGSKLVPPSPIVYKGDPNIYNAAYSADVAALNKTHINTNVTISREEVPPSRVGSYISPAGAGISFGVVRRHQLELDFAAIERGSHIAPGVSIQYLIPHTSLSIGPSVIYDKGAKPGIAAVVHF